MGDVLVDARSLSRTYGAGGGAVIALVDATFRISAGDRIALVGPSGSGKSTLLHLMAALDRPTSGEISWPALGPPDRLRPGPVAIAFQGPSLLPPLTVVENVELPILLAGGDPATAAGVARELLEHFELTPVASKLPEELSGGQAQRAGIARAFAGGPRLLLADEPTGQQDRTGGTSLIRTVLERIGASDAALVVATHDLAVADRLGVRWTLEAGALAG